MTHKVIMDCDTGRDDAMAIALALASPDEIEVLGITAVAGNIPLDLTQRNTRFVSELCGRRDIKVFAGADRPLMLPRRTAQSAHGSTGLHGVDVSTPTLALQPGHAVDFIIETLRAAGNDAITLVPTGPLTNIALAIMKAPELLPRIRQIVLMGGARVAGGNMSPVSEFNIHVDPHAARIVFGCGRPVVAFGLDVTYRGLARPEHRARLPASRSPAARALGPILTPMPGASQERFGAGAVPLHDPCTIAWLIRPSLFATRHVNVEVETTSALTMGQTVVDFWGYSERAANTH